MGTYRAKQNSLQNSYSASDVELTMTYDLNGIGVGSFLEIGTELLYVTGTNDSSKQATVLRGQRGTTAASYSAGEVVGVNPRFPRFVVKDVMKEEILSWPQDIYRQSVHTAATVTQTLQEIDCATSLTPPVGASDIYDVLRVWRRDVTTGREVRVYGYRSEPDIDGPGTCRVYLNKIYSAPTEFILQLARGFDVSTFAYSTDLVATVGLKTSFEEILKWGTAWRLVGGREVRRLFTESEGEGRKAEEVAVQANIAAARIFKQWRDMSLSNEVMKLRQRAGVRTRG